MLTAEDRAELDRIQIAWTDSPASSDGTNGMRVLLEAIYAAGATKAAAALAERDAKYASLYLRLAAVLSDWDAAIRESKPTAPAQSPAR